MFIKLLSFCRSLACNSCIVHVLFVAKVSDHKVSEYIKWVSLNNQQLQPRPTPIDLNPGELHCYPFVINANKCGRSCNTIDDRLGRIHVSNKIEDSNLKIFNMIKGINESKSFAKHI